MNKIETKSCAVQASSAAGAIKPPADPDKKQDSQDVHDGFRVRIELLGPEWSRSH